MEMKGKLPCLEAAVATGIQNNPGSADSPSATAGSDDKREPKNDAAEENGVEEQKRGGGAMHGDTQNDDGLQFTYPDNICRVGKAISVKESMLFLNPEDGFKYPSQSVVGTRSDAPLQGSQEELESSLITEHNKEQAEEEGGRGGHSIFELRGDTVSSNQEKESLEIPSISLERVVGDDGSVANSTSPSKETHKENGLTSPSTSVVGFAEHKERGGGGGEDGIFESREDMVSSNQKRESSEFPSTSSERVADDELCSAFTSGVEITEHKEEEKEEKGGGDGVFESREDTVSSSRMKESLEFPSTSSERVADDLSSPFTSVVEIMEHKEEEKEEKGGGGDGIFESRDDTVSLNQERESSEVLSISSVRVGDGNGNLVNTVSSQEIHTEEELSSPFTAAVGAKEHKEEGGHSIFESGKDMVSSNQDKKSLEFPSISLERVADGDGSRPVNTVPLQEICKEDESSSPFVAVVEITEHKEGGHSIFESRGDMVSLNQERESLEVPLISLERGADGDRNLANIIPMREIYKEGSELSSPFISVVGVTEHKEEEDALSESREDMVCSNRERLEVPSSLSEPVAGSDGNLVNTTVPLQKIHEEDKLSSPFTSVVGVTEHTEGGGDAISEPRKDMLCSNQESLEFPSISLERVEATEHTEGTMRSHSRETEKEEKKGDSLFTPQNRTKTTSNDEKLASPISSSNVGGDRSVCSEVNDMNVVVPFFATLSLKSSNVEEEEGEEEEEEEETTHIEVNEMKGDLLEASTAKPELVVGRDAKNKPNPRRFKANRKTLAHKAVEQLPHSSEEQCKPGNSNEKEGGSSMDSTARCAPRPLEMDNNNNNNNNAVDDAQSNSSEDSTTSPAIPQPRKKKIDLHHQFVREIVKIQHDREQYEKQVQSQQKLGTPMRRHLVMEGNPIADDVLKEGKSKREDGGYGANALRNDAFSQEVSSYIDKESNPSLSHVGFKETTDLSSSSAVFQNKKHRVLPLYRPPNTRTSSDKVDREHTLEPTMVESSRYASFDLDNSENSANSASASFVSPVEHSKPGRKKTLKVVKNLSGERLVKSSRADASGIKVTFDTERHERHIEFSDSGGFWFSGKRLEDAKSDELSHCSGGEVESSSFHDASQADIGFSMQNAFGSLRISQSKTQLGGGDNEGRVVKQDNRLESSALHVISPPGKHEAALHISSRRKSRGSSRRGSELGRVQDVPTSQNPSFQFGFVDEACNTAGLKEDTAVSLAPLFKSESRQVKVVSARRSTRSARKKLNSRKGADIELLKPNALAVSSQRSIEAKEKQLVGPFPLQFEGIVASIEPFPSHLKMNESSSVASGKMKEKKQLRSNRRNKEINVVDGISGRQFYGHGSRGGGLSSHGGAKGEKRDGSGVSFDEAKQSHSGDNTIIGTERLIGKWADLVEEFPDASEIIQAKLVQSKSETSTPTGTASTTAMPQNIVSETAIASSRDYRNSANLNDSRDSYQVKSSNMLVAKSPQQKPQSAKKSVWERLGPLDNSAAPSILGAPPKQLKEGIFSHDSHSIMPHHSQTSLDASPLYMQEMGFFSGLTEGKGESGGSTVDIIDGGVKEVVVRAYTDPKLKRSKRELYVPRRGHFDHQSQDKSWSHFQSD